MVNLIKYDNIKSTATCCLLDGPHDFNCPWMSYGDHWFQLHGWVFSSVCFPLCSSSVYQCDSEHYGWAAQMYGHIEICTLLTNWQLSIALLLEKTYSTYSTVITIFTYLVCGLCRRAGDLFWRGILWVSGASWWTIPLAGWGRSDLTSFPCQTGSVPCWWWWDIQYQRGTGLWGHSQ